MTATTAAKQKVYKDRNARRRARYAEDPNYRKGIIARERSKRKTEPQDCRENLAILETLGNVREYTNAKGVVDTGLTFTVEEAGKALYRTPKSLYKYFTNNLFPRPNHTVKGPTGMTQAAYTEQQMRRLIVTFGDHIAETPYYGPYHKDTCRALMACIN